MRAARQPVMGIAGTRTVVTMPSDKSKPPVSKNPFVQAQWRSDQRAEKGASKPDIWILRKGVVGFVYGLVAWTGYVVIGRVAVPMLRRRPDAGGGVGAGVGIIVGYVLLWLMFMWTYTMIVITGPGFARNHVEQSEDPNPPQPYLTIHSSTDTAVEPHDQGPNVSEFDSIANVLPAVNPYPTPPDNPTPMVNQQYQRGAVPPEELVRPTPRYHHGPRWCRFCKIIKPDRTHHCKHCGTCILLYDHHCPWIGQCVGWGNHKAFVVFCGWASLLALYIVLAGVIKSAKTGIIDGQVIGSIAAAALFGLFTFSMFTTHLTLIKRNTSTVESFALQDQSEREATILQREFGYCGGFKQKKAVRRRWNEEYGGVKVDGRWRTGGEMRQVMGDQWWSWFLPIGKPKGDGVHFQQNPHFGPNGEWLPKSQWPSQATV